MGGPSHDRLAAQVAAAAIVRAAAARVRAPEHLREAVAEQRRAATKKPIREVIVKRLLTLGARPASLALAALYSSDVEADGASAASPGNENGY